MASVSEMIHKRISTRAFLQTPVPEEKVRYILDVARFAPSGGNTQPWHCYVVAGEKKRALTESVLKDVLQPGVFLAGAFFFVPFSQLLL